VQTKRDGLGAFHLAVGALAGLHQRRLQILEADAGRAAGRVEFGHGGLHELIVVALGEVRAEMGAAAFLAGQAAFHDGIGDEQHVTHRTRMTEVLVGPQARVAQAHAAETLAQLGDLAASL
jgi:hypothetical protein